MQTTIETNRNERSVNLRSPQQKDSPSGLWEEVPCNLCGASEVEVKYAGTTDHDMEKMLSSYVASGSFVSKETLVTCNQCGLVFTSPRLSKELILKSYTEEEDPTYVSQGEGRMKSFERCLKAIEKYETGGRVLDVGAAAGFFLKVAKDQGWDTYGIEPSKYLSEYGRKQFGLNIRTGTIDSVPAFDKPMDVITLWDVLEHTFDPKEVVRTCNRYLRQNGLLIVNYPNISNWAARMAGRHYWFILSVHLYYFVPKTIEALLKQCGFEVLEQKPHFQWLEFGYLARRLEAYLPKTGKFIQSTAKMCGLSNTLIPYFAAQTRVIARKVKEI